MKSEQEELDNIIQDILDEDEYEPTFPDVNGQDKSTKDDLSGSKQKGKDKQKAKDKPKIKDKEKAKEKYNDKDKSIPEMIVMITRYVTLASVILFFVSLFMSWFSLSGNAVNYGFIRGEETRPMMAQAVQPYEVENLEQYDKSLVAFSARDLYTFSGVMEEAYLTVRGPEGDEVESMSAKIHSYYLKSTVLLFVLTIIAALILAIFKGTKGISIVRNLAVFNGIVIGLNYMALKIPYFSMFAIRAKDILKSGEALLSVSMNKDGIAVDQVFYPYLMTEEKGLYFAAFCLGLWLFLSIILTEVKNREEELAIEKGELD